MNAEREFVVIPHLFVALRAGYISKHRSLLVVLRPVHHEVDEAVVVENPRVERFVLVVGLDFSLTLVTSNHVGPFEELTHYYCKTQNHSNQLWLWLRGECVNASY